MKQGVFNNRKHFSCYCGDPAHTLFVDLDIDPYPEQPLHKDFVVNPELYFAIYLDQYRPWYRRLVVAIKYLLGYKSKYGDFSNIVLDSKEQGEELLIIVQSFIEGFDEKTPKT